MLTVSLPRVRRISPVALLWLMLICSPFASAIVCPPLTAIAPTAVTVSDAGLLPMDSRRTRTMPLRVAALRSSGADCTATSAVSSARAAGKPDVPGTADKIRKSIRSRHSARRNRNCTGKSSLWWYFSSIVAESARRVMQIVTNRAGNFRHAQKGRRSDLLGSGQNACRMMRIIPAFPLSSCAACGQVCLPLPLPSPPCPPRFPPSCGACGRASRELP